MKKILVIFAFLGMSLTPASAQEEDQLIFNHLGIGISVGTNMIGIDASTVLTPYFGIRAGINIWPAIKFRSNMHTHGDARHGGSACEAETDGRTRSH